MYSKAFGLSFGVIDSLCCSKFSTKSIRKSPISERSFMLIRFACFTRRFPSVSHHSFRLVKQCGVARRKREKKKEKERERRGKRNCCVVKSCWTSIIAMMENRKEKKNETEQVSDLNVSNYRVRFNQGRV